MTGNNIVKQVMGIALITFFYWGCNTDSKTGDSDLNQHTLAITANSDPDCVEFVALWSAGEIAKKIGRDKKWVFLNYTVDLWDIPPMDGAGNVVGKLRASSYARIIDTRGEDYLVESSLGQHRLSAVPQLRGEWLGNSGSGWPRLSDRR